MKNKYFYLNKVVIRTPTYSIKQLSGLQNYAELLADTSFLEALFISTPSLYNDFVRVEEMTDLKKKKKVIGSVYKFYSRMCTRATPYGLFANCGVLELASKTDVKMEHYKTFKKNIRLDMNYLCALAQHLEHNSTIKNHLIFHPNSSLYKIGDQYRYVEYRYDGSERKHYLSGVEASNYLEIVLFTAEKKGATIKELAESIIGNDINYEESVEYINELIENQLLMSELEPTVLTADFLDNIIQVISSIKEASDIYFKLIQIKSAIAELNKTAIGIDSSCYEKVIDQIIELGVGIDRSKLFQLDFGGSYYSNQLDEQTLQQITDCLGLLEYFNTKNYNPLEKFIEKFSERYEDEEIPITIALDNETGIYNEVENSDDSTSPLVDNIPIYATDAGNQKMQWNEKDIYLNDLIQEALFNKNKIIVLNESDIAKNFKKKESLDSVPSFSVMFSLLIEKGILKIDLGHAGGGASGVDLQARFAHTNESIHSNIGIIAQAEREIESDKIIADIVHLPEARTGNILMRPGLHEYQIPYLGKTTCDEDHSISIEDLMLSVKNGKLILRSKRLNKEVVTRLSNAHNYSMSALPIYSFLCKLQIHHQNSFFGFSLGNVENVHIYIPRFEYKNIILSAATWNLKKKHLSDIVTAFNKNDQTKCKENLCVLRDTFQIPSKVVLADGDNELYVDFENEISIHSFIEEIKDRAGFTLKEFLFNDETNIIESENGSYAHQLLAVFIKKKSLLNPTLLLPLKKQEIQRKFIPGSNWLYYKVYCGVIIADKILSEEIKPFAETLIEECKIIKWFFIRYNDTNGTHFRLRFELSHVKFISEIADKINQLGKQWIQNGLVHKIQNDTYNREIERYGSSTMALSEELFYFDSKSILNFISLIEGDDGERLRWLFALKYIDSFMDSFDLSLEQKIEFSGNCSAGFLKEFGGAKQTKDEINKIYREQKDLIQLFLSEDHAENEEFEIMYDIIEKARVERKEICQLILEIVNETSDIMLFDLLASYIHMSVNRLFRSKQRKNEMVIYNFINKYCLWKKNTQECLVDVS